jgi:hypothetical protein
MKFARLIDSQLSVWAAAFAAAFLLAPAVGAAEETGAAGVVFQRPKHTSQAASAPAATTGGIQFRSASAGSSAGKTNAAAASAANAPTTTTTAPSTAAGNPLRSTTAARVVPATSTTAASTTVADSEPVQAASHNVARPLSEAPRPAPQRPAQQAVQQTTQQAAPRAAARAPVHTASLPSYAEQGQDLSGLGSTRRARAISAASIEHLMGPTSDRTVQQAGYCDCGEPTCGVCGEPTCGICEPACGCAEPVCGCAEPTCGVVEPGCGLEAGCGCAEPDCGMVGCGSCVGNPGPDYWCFPVCLPRFKDLRFWGGVHGFKGPRDSPAFGGAGDGNFGFQEGFNIGGRAPLVSLLFPQLAYQFGFQAVQSQLSGRSDGGSSDRSQEFVTAGVFRRVRSGLQFGAVWDMMRDDFQASEDFHQLRYEVSIKGQSGLEFGFWGASHLNDKTVAGINYQSVDQYTGFVRWQFREGGSVRFWGGASNDSEGIVGADFIAPLSNRWAVNSGFNYLITDQPNGALGAQEESWNVGINLVWFYGFTAKSGNSNPFAPLFQTADNGWMFIDRTP